MSTAGELVRKMILAHASSDARAFRAAVEEYIAEERKKNHHVLARDLERVLVNGTHSWTTSNGSFALLGIPDQDLPRDKERGTVLVEVIEPRRTLDDLVLVQAARETLIRLITENRRADLLRSYGLKPSSKVLFCGPPGCGKTVAAETVAEALHLPLVLVRFDAVISSYLGETASNLRKVFTFARSRQMVMLFDEFDAIGKHRMAVEEHGELKRVVNSFLQMLDGFRGDSLLIAATNHQGLLDPALWRRFDEVILFERPGQSAIAELLRRNLHQIGIAPGVVLKEKADELHGSSHADIERIAREAIKATVLDGLPCVYADVLDRAIARYRTRVALIDAGQDDLSIPDV